MGGAMGGDDGGGDFLANDCVIYPELMDLDICISSSALSLIRRCQPSKYSCQPDENSSANIFLRLTTTL